MRERGTMKWKQVRTDVKRQKDCIKIIRVLSVLVFVTNTPHNLRLQHSYRTLAQAACCNYLLSEPIMKGKPTVTYTINCSYDPQSYRGVFNKPINVVYIAVESRDMYIDAL